MYTREHIASESMLQYPPTNSKDTFDSSSTDPPRLITPPPSPPRYVQHAVVEKKPQLDVQSLRMSLNLGDGRCGSRTKTTGNPCRMRVKPEEAKVNSKVEALISLTQSSLSLRTELHELAKPVHCDLHRGDKDLRYRIDQWAIAFPPGDSNLKHNASIEEQIEKVLGEISVNCAGINRKNKPCGWKIHGRQVQRCTETIKDIMNPEFYVNNDELERALQFLRENNSVKEWYFILDP